jgi:hypothetical protein
MGGRRRLIRVVYLFVVLMWPVTAARADAGVPMLMLLWPCAWVALLAIIPIEALIANKTFHSGLVESLKISAAANLVSTLAGIPLAWCFMCVVELATLQLGTSSFMHNWISTNGFWQRICSVTILGAWLPPWEGNMHWMEPIAGIFLCIPCFLVSVWSENLVARRYVPDVDRPAVLKWAWRANLFTYALMMMFFGGTFFYYRHARF